MNSHLRPLSPARPGAAAFTLTELLVVLAITGVLAAFVVPAVMGGLAKAKSAKCAGNLKQLYTASMGWSQDNNGWAVQQFHPSGTVVWVNALLPYLGSSAPKAGQRPPGALACSESSFLVGSWSSDYAINGMINDGLESYSWGFAKSQTSYKLATMNDPSKVFFIGDGRGADPATRARSLSGFVNNPRGWLHGRHDGKANVLFYDGHVEALDPTNDAQVPPGGTAWQIPPWMPRP
ncbi:MAG: prepilin-type N-terminal cleavage/methylation domain-containing protein [Verrucomicrobia bacterium]|nr:prepilin-type N-terminal cleavage/methylation domain-containing protein [Verrucomicrobiota bacterium]